MRYRILLALILSSYGLHSQVITTVAGTDFLFPAVAVRATAAPVGPVKCVAVDTKGNVYTGDPGNNMVMRLSSDGLLTVIAGNGHTGFSGDGGIAINASLSDPCVSVDSAGMVYIADTGNNRIRKLTPDGIIITIAGTGTAGFSGDGGPAIGATLNKPNGMVFDAAGNLFIADSGNNRVRKLTPAGIISTLAGSGAAAFAGDGGSAAGAALNNPSQVALDGAGNLYIADTGNNRIRKTPAAGGIITTVAGTSATTTQEGSPATSYALLGPGGVAVDASGNLYIADTQQHALRKVSPSGTITKVAGQNFFYPGFTGDGEISGGATLDFPAGLAIDTAGAIYIADSGNRRIRKITPNGIINSIAGNGGFRFSGDGGVATDATFNSPSGIVLDTAGNLYIADTENQRIRLVKTDGSASTFAGIGVKVGGFPVAVAGALAMSGPVGMAISRAGALHFSDFGNSLVARTNATGTIDYFGVPTFGPLSPTGLAFDAADTLYIADPRNAAIYKATANSLSIIPETAGLNQPRGLAFDKSGALYIAEAGAHRIRKLSGSTLTTVAGSGAAGFSGDGASATAARLNNPTALAFDGAGNLFIADTGNHRIRKVTPTGTITTVAGNGTPSLTGDGRTAASATLSSPQALAFDGAGNLYIADTGNHRIRTVLAKPPSAQVTPATLSFRAASGGTLTPPQKLSVQSGVAGMAYSVAVSSQGNWLGAQPSAGLSPATILITADPSALDPGIYTGTITVNVPDAAATSFMVSVEFNVSRVLPPKLNVDSPRLTFSAGPATTTQGTITIGNAGGGMMNFSAAAATDSGASWLSVTPSAGVVTPSRPSAVTVVADAASLPPGVYRGTVTVFSADTGDQAALPVTLVVNTGQGQILLSQTGMSFQSVAEGGAPLAQNLSIVNRGPGTLAWTASARTLGSGGSWLHLSQTAGNVARPLLDTSTIAVSADPAGLAPGLYFGQITVSSDPVQAQTVTVVLRVGSAAAGTGPQIQPAGLIFTGRQGEAPGSQNLQVRNAGVAPLLFNSARLTLDGSDWLQYIPQNANIVSSQPQRVVVQPGFTALTPGVREGSITFLFADGSINVVRVTSVVAAPGCTPARLVALPVNVPQIFQVTQNLPQSIEVQVVDDCGSALNPDRTGASVNASFSNRDRTLSLTPVGNGHWITNWQPVNSSDGPVFIAIVATMPQTNGATLTGRSDLEADLSGTADLPAVSRIVNAASLVQDVPVSRGSLFSVFGSGLADGSLLVAGLPAPVLMGGATQIIGETPGSAPVNTETQLIVQRGDTLSVPQPVLIAVAAPAIFTQDGSGSGTGVIADAASGTLNSAAAPAHAGDSIVILCTGLGTAEQMPAVSIGGLGAQVNSVRPGSVTPEAWEIVVAVPDGIEAGDAVPVRIAVAGQLSPAVTMFVR